VSTTSRVGAVLDALVTTLSAGTATAVYDGPPLVSDAPTTFVLVGATDEAESVVPIRQDWAGLGHNSRNETGEIPCAVVSQSGDTVIKTHRDAVLTILGELEAAIVADPTLGGAVQAGWLLIASGDLTQSQNNQGARVTVNFTVEYRARLQS